MHYHFAMPPTTLTTRHWVAARRANRRGPDCSDPIGGPASGGGSVRVWALASRRAIWIPLVATRSHLARRLQKSAIILSVKLPRLSLSAAAVTLAPRPPSGPARATTRRRASGAAKAAGCRAAITTPPCGLRSWPQPAAAEQVVLPLRYDWPASLAAGSRASATARTNRSAG